MNNCNLYSNTALPSCFLIYKTVVNIDFLKKYDNIVTTRSSSWGNEMQIFSRFMKDESGATALQYGIVAALAAVGIIAAAASLGSSVATVMHQSKGAIVYHKTFN